MDSEGVTLPAVIEGGAQETWVDAAARATALAYASAVVVNGNPPVRGVVRLGTGRRLCLQTP